MENYRITVIMGIYNCAPTLSEALDSLLNQTCQDFKVVMCDDGSSDNTAVIAQHYVERYPGKFILIKNERNMKLAATLNHCLEYADTDYVARMDGDDLSLPERFQKEIDFLDSHPEYALVSCPMIYFDESGDFKTGKCESDPSKEIFRYQTPFCHAPVMVRTDVYRDVDGYTVKKTTERREDYYLWYKIYKAGYRGYNLSEPLYKMRDDRNARSRRIGITSRINAYRCTIEVLKGLGLKKPRLYAFPILLKVFAPLIPYKLYRYLRK